MEQQTFLSSFHNPSWNPGFYQQKNHNGHIYKSTLAYEVDK